MKNQMRNDFCIFIITHERPVNDTYKQLQICNCKYPIYFVVDDCDRKIEEYTTLYGKDKICIFNKKEYESKMDMMDNFDFDKVIVYARNACFDFAEKLGYKYFLELDDDYTEFAFRFPNKHWRHIKDSDINQVLSLYVNYYESTPIKCIAFMQGGDFSCMYEGKGKRKAMNCLFCSTDRRIDFHGRLNEDVNAYTLGNMRGEIFISFANVTIHQRATQTGNGMSETYSNYGTYVKSFYSVMQCPSFVKISVLQTPSSFRIHHNVSQRYGVAKIISDKYKK